MKNWYKIGFLVINLALCYDLMGQDMTDTITINEVQIIEKASFDNVPGQKREIIKLSKILQSNALTISEVLNTQSLVNVRNYGASGISTISVRGAGASHTSVVWNGFNIQSFQNGQFDFSTLPIGASDKIALVYGGTGAQIGSGSIGGTLFVDNEIDFGDELDVQTQFLAGSYKRFNQYASAQYRSEKFATRLSFLNDQSENNFTYKNRTRFRTPIDTVKNGAIRRLSATSNTKIKTGDRSDLNFHLWATKQDAKDPGTMLSPARGHYTKTDNVRLAGVWKWNHKNIDAEVRSAYLYNHMEYAGDVTSDHYTHNQINELSLASHWNQFLWKLAVNQSIEWINSSDLTENPQRQKQALYGMIQRKWKYIEGVVIMRQEMVSHEAIPFTPAAGLDIFMSKNITFSTFVSRSYKLPTFNDLYWTGWGNPNLNSEDALNSEASIKYRRWKERNSFQIKLGGFRNQIKDIIIWLPQGTIWRPENLESVLSYGLEFESEIKHKFSSEMGITANGQYTWVKSMNEGKQLIYIPEHKAGINLLFTYRDFMISYSHIYTGNRYTDKLNMLKPLARFNTADIRVAQSFSKNQYKFNVAGAVKNVYNATYEVIQYIPTPPINFELSITITYKQ